MAEKSTKSKKNRSNPIKRFFVFVLGDERWQSLSIPLFCVLISLIAISIVLLLLKKSPIEAYKSLLEGAGLLKKTNYANHKGMITDFASMLNALTPMIFGALAVAIALKGGLFNIGVAGQMLLSGFVATALVGYSSLPLAASIPVILAIGILVGGLTGGLIGFLKYKFNTNEVVASIMINYIIQYITSFIINTRYIDPVSRQSRQVASNARLSIMNMPVGDYKMDIPIGIIFALIAVAIMYFIITKTRIGYEIKIVGLNPKAAKYAGMSVNKNIMLSMLISGALAGLAGVTYYLGYFGSIQPRILPDLGFDAIAVSLLGNSNPIGIVFASLLITVITKGSTQMTSNLGVRQEIAMVIVGLILLFSACSEFIKFLVKRAKDQPEEQGREIANEEGLN